MPNESVFENLLLGLLVGFGSYGDYDANSTILVSYNLARVFSQSRRSSIDGTSAS